MVDIYKNYEDLASKEREGIHFKITQQIRTSQTLIIAPHGGKIEFATSEITTSIAGRAHSFYLFESTKERSNKGLHITSANFDEPQALKALAHCRFAVGIHGRQDRGDPHSVWVGGLDTELMDLLDNMLKEADFQSRIGDHIFKGEDPKNVCNRGTSAKGAQLEIPKALRTKLLKEKALLEKFASAVRQAIELRLKQLS